MLFQGNSSRGAELGCESNRLMTGHLGRQSQNPGRRENIKQPLNVVWSLIIGLNMRKRLGSMGAGLTGAKLDFCFRGMVLPRTLISQSSETRTST